MGCGASKNNKVGPAVDTPQSSAQPAAAPSNGPSAAPAAAPAAAPSVAPSSPSVQAQENTENTEKDDKPVASEPLEPLPSLEPLPAPEAAASDVAAPSPSSPMEEDDKKEETNTKGAEEPKKMDVDDDDDDDWDADDDTIAPRGQTIEGGSLFECSQLVGCVEEGQACLGGSAQKPDTSFTCLSCSFEVLRFNGCRWSKDVDYYWFRNYTPDPKLPKTRDQSLAKLTTKLVADADAAAYACQCSWQSLSEIKKMDAVGCAAAPHGGARLEADQLVKWVA